MPTIQQQLNQLKRDKETLNTMLNTMGVETTGNETFTQLTPLVGKIVTDPILQDKSIEITENGTTNITADEGFDGLNNVEVVTNVASSGGGSIELESGIMVSEFNENGFPKVITAKNTTIPTYSFGVSGSSGKNNLLTANLEKLILKDIANISQYTCQYCEKLKTVVFGEKLQRIENGCFSYCPNLELEELPETIITISEYAFRGCAKITIKKIPDSVTKLPNGVFYECVAIPQISMKNVTSIGGSSATTSCFRNSTNLKGVWIGSAITDSGLLRHCFNGCTSLQKMFIDLPRATVEAFTNYQYAFMNDTSKTGIIVCNDDEGFMSKEQFDSIDWATYTG